MLAVITESRRPFRKALRAAAVLWSAPRRRHRLPSVSLWSERSEGQPRAQRIQGEGCFLLLLQMPWDGWGREEEGPGVGAGLVKALCMS